MRIWLTPVVLFCALVAGCATKPSTPSTARIVVAPSKSLVFINVRADIREDGTVVRGRVTRRTMMTGAVWGHLHVEALTGSVVVAWADTRWSQLSRRRLPTSSFQVRLPNTASQIDEIRVSHVLTGHGKARRSGNPS